MKNEHGYMIVMNKINLLILLSESTVNVNSISNRIWKR